MEPAHHEDILGSGRIALLIRNFGARWSDSRPSRFTPQKELPVFIEKVVLWAPENKTQYLSHTRIRIADHSVRRAVAMPAPSH